MTDWVERLKRALQRGYRFEGEQANHAEQAAQTNVSIGLMAAAARAGDDDHRIQAMTTEHTLRARQSVLEGKLRQGWKFWLPPAQRALTREERGELESIRKGLAELHAPQATPETMGGQRLAAFGAVGQRRGFLGVAAASPVMAILASPITWIVVSLAAIGIQTARLNNAKGDLRDARADLQMAERNLDEARATAAQLAEGIRAADVQSQQTAALVEAERARRLRAERQAQRIRDEQRRATEHAPSVDYGFGGLRDAGAVPPGPGGGDAASSDPGGVPVTPN